MFRISRAVRNGAVTPRPVRVSIERDGVGKVGEFGEVSEVRAAQPPGICAS